MRHDLIRHLLLHFLERAGLAPKVRVFTRPGAFERYEGRRGGLTRDERAHLRAGLAISSWNKTGLPRVYVNQSQHATVSGLVDTAAHEAAHLRWRSMPHGELFDRRVKALLDGYSCTAPRKRLPSVFR